MWNSSSPYAAGAEVSDRLSAPLSAGPHDMMAPSSGSLYDPALSTANMRRRTSQEVKGTSKSKAESDSQPKRSSARHGSSDEDEDGYGTDTKEYLPGPNMQPRHRSRGRTRPRRRPARRVFRRWALYLCLGFVGWCLFIRLNEAHREALEETLRRGRDALAGRLARAGVISWQQQTCHFVSPVEAYHEDLRRLRTLLADQEGFDISFRANVSRLDENTAHSHTFSSTGHLLFSDEPDQPHPIPILLARGEAHWQALRARQSKTLGEAAREYERRYGRKPPRGFEVWWRAVEEHSVVLPDEYDRIDMDLAPFRALPKAEMRRRLEMVQRMKETFTVQVKDGQLSVQIGDEGGLQWDGTMPRAKDAGSLINAFAHHLPDLNATFSIFDQPQIYLSWARRASLISLGLKNQHTTHLEEYDEGDVQLSRSCPPDSNLRTRPDMREGRSFVYDTLAAGDLCQNPYIVPAHGLTIEPHTQSSHPRPHTQLLPLFSLAKTSINSDILITPLDQFFDKPGRDPPWSRKRSSKLAWRGSPTGISKMTRSLPWRDSHRVRLHTYANNQSQELVDYLTPDLGQEAIAFQDDPQNSEGRDDEGREAYRESLRQGQNTGDRPPGTMMERAPLKAAANFFLDVKLAGKPLQCDEEDGTCDDLGREIEWAKHQPSRLLNQHKFLLDVDGNGWRLMSTNSLVIKAGIFTEWFQPHLIPCVLALGSGEVTLDYTDLFDILSFFRGSPYQPNLGFDKTAEAIAHNGKCFVQRMFRLEDLQVYMLRLFLEYARLVADESIDMDFDYESYRRKYGQPIESENYTDEQDADPEDDPEAVLERDEQLQDIDDQPDQIPWPEDVVELDDPVAVEFLSGDGDGKEAEKVDRGADEGSLDTKYAIRPVGLAEDQDDAARIDNDGNGGTDGDRDSESDEGVELEVGRGQGIRLVYE